MIIRRRATRVMLIAVVSVCGPWGCKRSAPLVLQQGLEVYQDKDEGFSLRPPPGWLQAARGSASKAEREQEALLVKYKHGGGDQMAFFYVSAIDLPEQADISAFLTQSLARDEKRTSTQPEELQVGGERARRESFTTKWDKGTMIKEVVSVRRGPRVYFFTATYPAANKEIRDNVRKVIDSVTWG